MHSISIFNGALLSLTQQHLLHHPAPDGVGLLRCSVAFPMPSSASSHPRLPPLEATPLAQPKHRVCSRTLELHRGPSLSLPLCLFLSLSLLFLLVATRH